MLHVVQANVNWHSSPHFLGSSGAPNAAFKGSHMAVHHAVILPQAELELFLLLDSVKEHSSVGWSGRWPHHNCLEMPMGNFVENC